MKVYVDHTSGPHSKKIRMKKQKPMALAKALTNIEINEMGTSNSIDYDNEDSSLSNDDEMNIKMPAVVVKEFLLAEQKNDTE